MLTCVCLFYIELTTTNVEYRQKVSSGRTADKLLHTLSWNVDLYPMEVASSLFNLKQLDLGKEESYLSTNLASPSYENAL